MHIIIPSDSSRRGFQQNIQSYQPFLLHWKISLLVIPKAIIEKLTRETKNILKLVKDNSQCTNTMFFVEICNLTEKSSSNTHQFVTKFVIIHLKKFIPQFKQIINLFKSFGLSIAKYILPQFRPCL